jgi:hypothetical protein
LVIIVFKIDMNKLKWGSSFDISIKLIQGYNIDLINTKYINLIIKYNIRIKAES